MDVVKAEFKTPEKMRYERAHALTLEEQHNLNRQMIAENMSVAAHYASSSRPSSTSSASSGQQEPTKHLLQETRDCFGMKPSDLDRVQLNLNRQLIAESSSSGQTEPSKHMRRTDEPDYTQVSPAKMALRRHLSQEKISQQFGPSMNVGAGGDRASMASKTIGDLVNGEIERTLEISNQSIINAAINMSNVGSGMDSKTVGDLKSSATVTPSRFRPEYASVPFGNRSDRNQTDNMLAKRSERNRNDIVAELSGAVINISAQRPERVNVRVVEEMMPAQHQPFGQVQKSNYNRVSSREITESPVHLHGQSNLATLAHVAYNQKNMNQHGMPVQSRRQHVQGSTRVGDNMYKGQQGSATDLVDLGVPNAHAQAMPAQASAMNPLTIQTISPRASSQFSPVSAANLRYQPTPPSPHTPRSSSSTISQQSDHVAPVQHPAQPKYMPLPRADMKPHLESYFAEQKQQKQLSHAKIPVEEKRRNNTPLEGNFQHSISLETGTKIYIWSIWYAGLAATLQACVQARFSEERHKRSDINSQSAMQNGNITITPTAHIKTEGIHLCSHLFYFYVKVGTVRTKVIEFFCDTFAFAAPAAVSLKRSSPIVHHRVSKIRPHYPEHHLNDSLLSPESHREQLSTSSGRHSATMELMSPDINSMLPDDRSHHIRPKHDDG